MTAHAPESRSQRSGWAAYVLVISIIVVYARTLSAPFEFDDEVAIVHNTTLRDLGQVGAVLVPPHREGATVGGRPLLNLTFAINYAISGESVWSYHLVNIAIHIGGALLLLGIAERTIRNVLAFAIRPSSEFGADAVAPPGKPRSDMLAFIVAALWALHPLQTEAVTYVSQRAESLASFFYLLALYSFWRAVDAPPARLARGPSPGGSSAFYWLLLSVLAALYGVATKEIVCTAPLLILLFDSTLVAGSFRAVWRARRSYYLGLATSWIVLATLVISTEGRGGTAGFGTNISVWSYLLTQMRAITHYLRLAVWPTGLVFDHGTAMVQALGDVWLPATLVAVLAAISFIGFVRAAKPTAALIGLLGVAFFVLLAPSSSFVPIGSQPIAEHRMYLPLAPISALAVAAAARWLDRWTPLLIVAVIACGVLTYRRNQAYRTEIDLWSDTVEHAPTNARAHNNLGNALVHLGQFDEAVAEYEAAVRLEPGYADAQSNLGYALVRVGRANEAMAHEEIAVKLKPNSPSAWLNYGLALSATGHDREAIPAFEKAIGGASDSADAPYNLGNAYYRLGDFTKAAESYETALTRDPRHRDARFNLAYAWLQRARPDEALKHFQMVVQQHPEDAGAHAEVGNLLAYFGRPTEAAAQFETALRLQPDFPAARAQLDRLRPAASRSQ